MLIHCFEFVQNCFHNKSRNKNQFDNRQLEIENIELKQTVKDIEVSYTFEINKIKQELEETKSERNALLDEKKQILNKF